MKTQCPHCRTVQDVPNHYANKEIKCSKCTKPFKADILPPSINKPDPPPSDPSEPLRLPSAGYLHFSAIIIAAMSILGVMTSLGNVVVIMGCVTCLVLSFILAGIALVVDAVNDNTRAREKK